MHEIITLQFGKQSNYIGTHFWNAQESYFTYNENEQSPINHDVHFRAGMGSDGTETFTPRAVIYDVKDNFGTLRQVNALYEIQDQPNAPAAWARDPLIRQQPRIPPHEYQIALDAGNPAPSISPSSVRFWSDFNRVFYHPRSMVQLNFPTSHLQASTQDQVEPLDQWDVGEDLFKNEDQEHDLLDRDLRPFIEESDQLQGFQVITGADDAWAGFSGRYVERLRDEYGRKSIWMWGAENASEVASREKKRHQANNLAKTLSLLSDQASLYVPLSNQPAGSSPPYLDAEMRTRWQTSALQATALESVTLPTRLTSGGGDVRGLMGDMEPIFTNEVRRNVLELSLSASAPENDAPMTNGASAADHRMVNGARHDNQDATPQAETLDVVLFRSTFGDRPADSRARQNVHIFSQNIVSRSGETSSNPPVAQSSPYSAIVQTYSSSLLAPRPSSFPHIFNLRPLDAHAGFATKTALTASTAVTARFRSLADIVRRSIGVEQREELRADLLAKAEEYIDGWEPDDSSDDDA